MLEANATVVAHSFVMWKLACMLISKQAFLVLMGIYLSCGPETVAHGVKRVAVSLPSGPFRHTLDKVLQ